MKFLFGGCKRFGFLCTLITRALHGLKLQEMQSASSNKCISSSMYFWYLWGMGYGCHAICGPVVDISISNKLVWLGVQLSYFSFVL